MAKQGKKQHKENTHKVVKNPDTGNFDLIELSSNFVLKSDANHDDVYNYYRFVKGGGAFAGFTPTFMMIDISTAKRVKLDV